MKERIFNVLNIKVSESKQIFDLLTVQFFIGLANAFINIVAFTLFIYTFSIHELPVTYLGISVALLILNFVYEKAEHKLSPLQLFKLVIGFSLVLLFIIWLGLSYGNKNTFIFLLLAASTIIYMLTGYTFWGLVSLLFNVRESRRVFAVVGAGDIPAKLIGYLFAPLLIPLFGLTNAIWFSLFAFAFGLILFTRIIRRKRWNSIRKKSHHEKVREETNLEKRDWIIFFFKNRLIFSISLLSIISYNVFILVDYTFIAQVKPRFENITDLAKYIATFFALGRSIALLFKLIFTSRLIERLGIISCLFITPVTLLIFCFIFFIYGKDSTYTIYIFGVMAMLTEVLRSTMQEPVFFILFQPLKEQLRLKGHMISKGYMLPLSFIIVGLTLVVMHNAGIAITIMLVVKLLLLNLALWAFVIFFISSTYLKTIHSSLRRNFFSSDEIYVHDDKVFEILLNKINNGQKKEVVYALKLLDKAKYPDLDNLLEQQLLNNADSEIKKYILDELELRGKINVEILKNLLSVEYDIEVKQKIVSILCQHDTDYLKAASENIAGFEYEIRKIIIINLLNQKEFIYLFKAGNEIDNLINSTNPAERELAIHIIGELKHVQFENAIKELTNDPEQSVKRSAILAACKLKIAKLLPAIIGLLDTPEKYLVIKGLHQYGDSLFLDIKDLPVEVLQNHSSTLIKVAGKVKGHHSINFLLTKLNDPSSPTEKIIHALWLKEYQHASPSEIEKLHKLLNHYLFASHEKINNYYEIPDFKHQDLMKRSIYNETRNDLITALEICAILFRKKEINRIIELMHIEKNDKLYNAMEMLELVLPKKISIALNYLFDFVLDPKYTKKIFEKNDVKTFFNKILFNDVVTYNPWTKAVYMYCSWKNNDIDMFKNLNRKTDPNEPLIIKETRDHVLAQLNN